MEKVWVVFGVFVVEAIAGSILLMQLMRAREVNVQERQAWYMLGIFGLTAAGYALLTLGLRYPWFPSTAVWALFGWAGLTGLIGRSEKKRGLTVLDERDREIAAQATLAGYGVFWLAFVLACMAPFYLKGPNGSVTLPTTVFALPVYIGMMIVFSVRSLVVVILYRRQAHGQEA